MQHPPAKRRKLSNHMPHSRWMESRAETMDQPRAFAHDVESLEEAQLAQEESRDTESHQVLLLRQDTALSSAVTTATMASSSISSASMDTMPATGASATGVAAASEVTSSDASATTSNAGLALSVLLSASVSLPLSEIASVATGLPVSVVSGLLGDVSSLVLPSDSSFTSSSIAPNETAPASSSSLGNDTMSTSSAASISGGNSTSSSLLPASSSTGFLTSSFSRNSTIAASQTSSSSKTESSSSESALAFIATLSQGDVTTLSRSAEAYTTALDGTTLTVSAADSSLTQASRTTNFVSFSDSSSATPFASMDGSLTSFAAPTSTEPASGSGSSGSSTPPAGTIAGGVVGGAAGLALVALIAMLAVRWYRRQGVTRHQALPQGPGSSPDLNTFSSSGPGMAERAGLAPLAAAVPALFRYQNRAADGEETLQRGFTRVSGRKLPSAFSGGAGSQPSSELPVNRDADADPNDTSFYRDSSGFYGGSGSPPSPSGSFPLRSDSYEQMTISPGPQRTPRLHSGGPYGLSPGGVAGRSSPQAPSALTRSDAPFLLDPNRNSRFSEGL